MLKYIRCDLFSEKQINFRNGLNIIQGDSLAKNSIGKSTALMAIDFVLGGSTFTSKDHSGSIKHQGHHHYDWCLEFSGEKYFFKRKTEEPTVIYRCDDNLSIIDYISIENYFSFLKSKYQIDECASSFRSLVSPFIRIWKKGCLDTDFPFSAVPSENNSEVIRRLIELFGFGSLVNEKQKEINQANYLKKIINRSMREKLVPSINLAQYKKNKSIINKNANEIGEIKHDFFNAVSFYENSIDEKVIHLKNERDILISIRNKYQTTCKRIEREISGVNLNLDRNISLIKDFFPNVNEEKLSDINNFHAKISRIIKKSLKDELTEIGIKLINMERDISSKENEISEHINNKELPKDIFNKIFELKEETDSANNENYFYELKEERSNDLKKLQKTLEETYIEIFEQISYDINRLLKKITRIVYGFNRSSASIQITSPNSYKFFPGNDTGTGKSFSDLIASDIAMISLTKLPFFIHDSVVYKNIEIKAIRRILRIYKTIKDKQIFISLDEASKYDRSTQEIMNRFTSLELNEEKLLYVNDWRCENN